MACTVTEDRTYDAVATTPIHEPDRMVRCQAG